MLGTTDKWFHSLIMEDSIWKFACLCDLQLPEPRLMFLILIKLYASAFELFASVVQAAQESKYLVNGEGIQVLEPKKWKASVKVKDSLVPLEKWFAEYNAHGINPLKLQKQQLFSFSKEKYEHV
ncbi:hypothetical protein PVL29_020202 [Vitis rotundifolia]|uniref:Uncharacterized protein n=1 Tax=Vitis rotundifolia TaxID=103349 RepID=A0AA38Z2K2_VITRO|nr:hypothetical protein PVL29_020202 [Vitis rotundifolia]